MEMSCGTRHSIKRMSKKRISWWSNLSEEQKAKIGKLISSTKKKQYELGITKPLTGIKHPMWKGGYSRVVDLLYANRTLYTKWKLPILENSRFKCSVCGETQSLTVHHDKERLADIFRKIIGNTNIDSLSIEEKNEIVRKVVNYHIDNKVSGVVLCKVCHKKQHPSYNFK